MKYFLLYLLIINAASFLLMLIDKQKARKKQWRIPERTLFLSAILGGSIGTLGGMYAIRHKTKHLSFTLGIPVILMVQIAIFIYIFHLT